MSEEVASEETTATEGKQFSQDELNAIIAKETTKASRKATSDFVSTLGFSNQDELKGALDALKTHQESQKTAEQRLAELEQEKKSLSGRAGKYQETLQALLDAELQSIPEDKRSLVPEFDDPADRLAYIAKNRSHLTAAQTAVTVGSQSSPSGAPTATDVTFEQYQKMTPRDVLKFHTENAELAATYARKLSGF